MPAKAYARYPLEDDMLQPKIHSHCFQKLSINYKGIRNSKIEPVMSIFQNFGHICYSSFSRQGWNDSIYQRKHEQFISELNDLYEDKEDELDVSNCYDKK